MKQKYLACVILSLARSSNFFGHRFILKQTFQYAKMDMLSYFEPILLLEKHVFITLTEEYSGINTNAIEQFHQIEA